MRKLAPPSLGGGGHAFHPAVIFGANTKIIHRDSSDSIVLESLQKNQVLSISSGIIKKALSLLIKTLRNWEGGSVGGNTGYTNPRT